MEKDCTPKSEKIFQQNEAAIRNHLEQIVRNTVEQTLNDMLGAEVDQFCNAEKSPYQPKTQEAAIVTSSILKL